MKKVISFLAVLLALLLASPFSHAETKRILAIGNSFSYDAVLQELIPVVRSGGDDIIVGFPYKGGTTLQLHWQYITGKEKIYNYYTIRNGTISSTGSASRCLDENIIASEPWDVVVIQTDHNYSGAYSHYFPWLDNLISYLREHLTNKQAKFYLYMTWAYQNGSAKMAELVKKGLYENQADQYAKITDCASRAAVQSGIGIENIIPAGTAVQNGRTSYLGDSFNRDGYHLDLRHGRYTASLTWYAKIFGKDPEAVEYHPDGMSDFCAAVCRKAVAEAIRTPFSVTSLKDEYGVNPDAAFSVLDRPVFVNFGLATGYADTGAGVWNSLTSQVAGAALRNLYNAKGYGTDVSITVDEAFGGIANNGLPYTGNELTVPDNAARSSFCGQGSASLTISGLYPGQAYDLKVYSSAPADALSTFRFSGENSGEASINAASGSSRLASVPDIVADKYGRIRLVVSSPSGSYYLNALAIVPHLSVPGLKAVRINFTDAGSSMPESGWNNVTSHIAASAPTALAFDDGTASGISMSVTRSFAGTTSDGPTATETPLGMPSSVSSSGYWVNGVKKDGVLADCAEILFSGLDSRLTYTIQIFGSKANADETYEAEYSTFGKSDNFIALNCNNNTTKTASLPSVMPDADGRIRFTVTPGATSEDTYKVGYINAMTIMVPAMIDVVPFEPVALDPWDGRSTVEPAVDPSGNYMIYCGAELAWVADRVNKGLAVSGIRLAKDIDLGNMPWTPIGYGTWFKGNFDGQGYHINNLYINKDDLTANTQFCGLIGGTNNGSAYIRNIRISGKIEIPSAIAVKTVAGSLIGKANSIGSVSNCHSDVEFAVNGSPAYVGGLVGFLKNSEVRSCSFSGTVTVNGSVTNGLGGIAGTTNSSVAGVEAIFNGCIFSGSITNKGSKAPKYVGGINAYSSVASGSESITNCYVSGKITSSGTSRGVIYGTAKTPEFFCGNNFYLDDFGYATTGGTKASAADFHSGRIAYLLNADRSEMLFGQNLDDPESMPEVYLSTGANHVYRVTFSVNGVPYRTLYCNSALRLPPDPDLEGGKTFGGWYDADGNKYTSASVIDSDLDLEARTTSGIEEITSGTPVIVVRGNTISVSHGEGFLTVLSPDGKTILRHLITAPGSSLDISSLPRGIYIASFGPKVLKFVK